MEKILAALSFYAVFLADISFSQDIDGCPTNLPYNDRLVVHGEKCYYFVHKKENWKDARIFCHSKRADMVKIDSPETNDFIIAQLAEISWNNDVWIGLNDEKSEGSWRWESLTSDGHVAHWTYWAEEHPLTGRFDPRKHPLDCVYMDNNDNWRWHEALCDTFATSRRFICEFPYEPTSEEGEENALAQEGAQEKDDNNITYVALGIGLLLLCIVIVAIILAAVFYRRRRKQIRDQPQQRMTEVHDNQTNHSYRHEVEHEYRSERIPGDNQNGVTGAITQPPPYFSNQAYDEHSNAEDSYPSILPTKQHV